MNNIDTSALVYDRTAGSFYNAADINRVAEFCETVINAAIAEIAALAQMRETYDVAPSPYSLPDYTVTPMTVKKDYTTEDTYTAAQMIKLLSDAEIVITTFPPIGKKQIPSNMRYLTYIFANNIEYNLKYSAGDLMARSILIENNIKKIAADFWYSGEINCGEV